MQLSCEVTIITRLLVVELNGSCRLFLVGQTQRPRDGFSLVWTSVIPYYHVDLAIYSLQTIINSLLLLRGF